MEIDDLNFDNLKTVAECDKAISVFKKLGGVPSALLARRAALLAQGETMTVYGDFKTRNDPTPELCECIEKAADSLLMPGLDAQTALKPVMLYGKVQSGKTRAFVGVLSIAFDRGVDIAVIYTKGTNALARQTVSRMKSEFSHFKIGTNLSLPCTIVVKDVLDFHSQPPSDYEINKQRHIIVCKKEANNTKQLKEIFAASTLMRQKKVVVIDDEADFGGLSFYSKAGEVKAGTNALNITETVKSIPWCRNMLVTATPYSLYLQPDGMSDVVNGEVRPMRPRHSQMVPVHGRYVGGRQYFVESANPDSMYHSVFHPLSPECVNVLWQRDARYLKNIATSKNLHDFRYAVLQYLVGTAIRGIQEAAEGSFYRSSFIVHVMVSKESHEWQRELLQGFLEYLGAHVFCFDPDDALFDAIVLQIYEDFCVARKNGEAEGLLGPKPMPTLAAVKARMTELLGENGVHIQVVNSDEDVDSLLDASGQLELNHPANVFVGGNIIDRGITIENLIGFVYGRSPKTMQMDTVLQHARMYGARNLDDMAVTRFHTTNLLYARLRQIDEMDEALRNQFEKAMAEGKDLTDVFVCRDGSGQIVPCSPSKLLMSSLTTIAPQSRHLPVGFLTDCQTAIKGTIDEIDKTLAALQGAGACDENGIFMIGKDLAIDLLHKIRSTYIYDRPKDMNAGLDWEVDETIGVLEWALGDEQELYCLQRKNRDMSRVRQNGGFVDAPDDGKTDSPIARAKAVDRPLVMFIRENGKAQNGWRDAPFYWPVLFVQKNVRSAVYGKASE